jgi:hypothetical protein
MLSSSPCSSCTPGRGSSPTEGWCASPSRCSFTFAARVAVLRRVSAYLLALLNRDVCLYFLRPAGTTSLVSSLLPAAVCCSRRRFFAAFLLCFSFGACLSHAPQVLQVSRTRAIAAHATHSARVQKINCASVLRARENSSHLLLLFGEFPVRARLCCSREKGLRCWRRRRRTAAAQNMRQQRKLLRNRGRGSNRIDGNWLQLNVWRRGGKMQLRIYAGSRETCFRMRLRAWSKWQRAVNILPDEQNLRRCYSKRGNHPISGTVTQHLKIVVLELKSDNLLAYLDIEVQQLANGFDPHAIALLHPFQIRSGERRRRLTRFSSFGFRKGNEKIGRCKIVIKEKVRVG